MVSGANSDQYWFIVNMCWNDYLLFLYLPQSRESLSSCESDASDGEGARGDCEGSGSSSESIPCQVGLLERLVRTHPVWFLPGIQRAGAFHLLQGKEEGVLITLIDFI
jgi:hypothetical protein